MEKFFKEYWFLIVLLAAASVISFLWLFIFNRKKLNATWWELVIVSILHTIVGVLFVKFFALLEAGFDTKNAGAISMYGGIFFMPLFYFVYAKIKKLPVKLVFDIFTVSLVSTLFMARINCLYSGCCAGIYIGDSHSFRYPARELELVFDAIVIGLFIYFILKDKNYGKIYPIYLISYGVFRFINEFFRESKSNSFFHIAHLWSIIALVAGITILIIDNYLQKDKEKHSR